MKVLTITPWYPSEKDSMSGLFVRNFVDETAQKGAIQTIFSGTRFFDILKAIFHYSKKRNRPDVIHLHVVTKQGLLPLFLNRFFNVPYIITEHWAGYFHENGFYKHLANRPLVGWIYKSFTKKVFSKAAIVTAVSQMLIARLKELGLVRDAVVLYNIVPSFFAKSEAVSTPEGDTEFINVTCFSNKAKNLTGIIDAIKIIKDKHFRFTFVGDGEDMDMVVKYAHSQGVYNKVRFTGVLEPTQVAQLMNKASCLVMNSNYETACVVLQEALAVGLPIISTPVGIAPEFKEQIETIEVNNPESLAKAMAQFIDKPKDHYQGLDDFKQVPAKLYSMYETLLSSR